MTLREELAKLKQQMAEEECFRASNDIHPSPLTPPRDCRLDAAELKDEAKRKVGRPQSHE